MIFFQPGVGVAVWLHKNISFWGPSSHFFSFFSFFGFWRKHTPEEKAFLEKCKRDDDDHLPRTG